jgi:hypothetical protein
MRPEPPCRIYRDMDTYNRYVDERPLLSIAGQTVLRNELIHCPVNPSDPSIMGAPDEAAEMSKPH